LRERGLLVTAIRPPTVPAGSARLRVTLSAAHTGAQVEQLLAALAECYSLLDTVHE
jgi:8-amino-7-oxononanoate synthase